MTAQQELIVNFFYANVMPHLSRQAQDFFHQWQAGRDLYNELNPHPEDQKLPAALDAMRVLIDCTEQPIRFLRKTSHWTDNQCVFYIELNATDLAILNLLALQEQLADQATS